MRIEMDHYMLSTFVNLYKQGSIVDGLVTQVIRGNDIRLFGEIMKEVFK
jgi:hypothetical protein